MTNYCDAVVDYVKQDPEPERIVFEMSLSDIALSNNFSANGIENTKPISGEEVEIKYNNGYFNILKNRQQIASLSKSDPAKPDRLSNKIIYKSNNGYFLENKVEIDYMVTWQDNESRVFKQVLCKVYMSKR